VNVEEIQRRVDSFPRWHYEFTLKGVSDVLRVRARPLRSPGGGAGGIVTYPDRDPFHYDFDAFRRAAQRAGLDATNLGGWGHPRGQKLMVFRNARTG
jgi:hypothetical protein